MFTPELKTDREILIHIATKVSDLTTDVAEIMPLVYKHEEAIEGVKRSVTWIKRIMLTVLSLTGVGGVIAKFWNPGT